MAGFNTNQDYVCSTFQKERNRLLLPAWFVLVVLIVMPGLIMLVYSFLTKEFRGGVIWDFSLAAYDQFFFYRGLFGDEPPIIEWTYINIFWRSTYQALIATLISFLIGFPTAYFIATRPEKYRGILLFLITIPYWVNLLIRTVSMKFLLRDHGPMNDFLIYAGLIESPLQIINTNLAVQIGLFYSYLPFMVLPIYAAAERYNMTLSEAAADLYATKWTTLRKVVFPAIRPGVLAGMTLVFIPSLGSFLAPDLLGGAKTFMIGSLIEEQFRGSAGNWPFGAAASMILLTPILLILIVKAFRSKNND